MFPCGTGTVLNDPPLVCDQLLRWRIQGNSVYLHCSKSVRRPSRLLNFRCQWRWRNSRVWLQNKQLFDFSGLHHSTCGVNKHRDRSIHWSKCLPSSSNCAMGKQRAFPHFVRMLSCRLDPPQTDGAWWLHTAQATSTDLCLLALRHSKLPPLTTITELSASLDCGSPSADRVTSPGELHRSEL